MLPDISLNPNTQDIGKQVSSLRSQLAQLKDAVESDLNNIGYENLSATLKKKIDDLGTTITGVSEQTELIAQNISANYASLGELDATIARVGIVEAGIVNIRGSLSAVVADIQTINSKMVTTDYLAANYATIGALNSVTISASQITSGTISADRISSNIFKSRYIQCLGLQFGDYLLTQQNITINGTSYILLGAIGGTA